jgi:hypothetical protein
MAAAFGQLVVVVVVVVVVEGYRTVGGKGDGFGGVRA